MSSKSKLSVENTKLTPNSAKAVQYSIYIYFLIASQTITLTRLSSYKPSGLAGLLQALVWDYSGKIIEMLKNGTYVKIKKYF